MMVVERRQRSIKWPKALERRAHLKEALPVQSRRTRLISFATRHSITTGMWFTLFGLIGLVVGTAYGSLPGWPAPVVFYATTAGAILATMHAIVRPMKQPRIAAVLGTLAAGALRGIAYAVQAPDVGLRLGAAVGAYLITVGFGIIIIALAAGETMSGEHRTWDV